MSNAETMAWFCVAFIAGASGGFALGFALGCSISYKRVEPNQEKSNV